MGTDGHGKIVNLPRVSFLFSWGLLIKILKLPTDTEQLVVACFTDDKLKVIKGATEDLRNSSSKPYWQHAFPSKDRRVGLSKPEFGTPWAFGLSLAFRSVLFIPYGFVSLL